MARGNRSCGGRGLCGCPNRDFGIYGIMLMVVWGGVTVTVTTADVEFMGEVVGATIVMGDDRSEPLFGGYGVGVGWD